MIRERTGPPPPEWFIPSSFCLSRTNRPYCIFLLRILESLDFSETNTRLFIFFFLGKIVDITMRLVLVFRGVIFMCTCNIRYGRNWLSCSVLLRPLLGPSTKRVRQICIAPLINNKLTRAPLCLPDLKFRTPPPTHLRLHYTRPSTVSAVSSENNIFNSTSLFGSYFLFKLSFSRFK